MPVLPHNYRGSTYRVLNPETEVFHLPIPERFHHVHCIAEQSELLHRDTVNSRTNEDRNIALRCGDDEMSDLNVMLTSECFIGVVASSVEAFKSEVGGILFGDHYRSVNKIMVSQAIPLQTTSRTPTEVHYHPERTERVLSMWDDLSSYWPVGYFHSHPEYGGTIFQARPSEGDKETIADDEIELIVSIYEAIRSDKLGYIRELRRISGAVGNYYIEMAAWYKDDSGNIREADLWCPYINVINLSSQMHVVTRPGRLYESDSIVPNRELRTLRRLVRKYERAVFRSLNENVATLRDIKKVLKKIHDY